MVNRTSVMWNDYEPSILVKIYFLHKFYFSLFNKMLLAALIMNFLFTEDSMDV